MSNQNTAQEKNASPFDATSPNYTVASSSDDARAIVSATGTIIFTNENFNNLCGEVTSLEGTPLTDIIDINFDGHLPAEGQQQVMLIKNHQIISLQFDWINTQNNQNFLVISAEQVTAREKLKQFIDEKIREKYQNNIDTSPFIDLSFDALCITSTNGNFIHVNQNFIDLFGYNLEELDSKNLVDLVHPEYRIEFRNIFYGLSQTDTRQHQVALDSYFLNSDGEALWVEWNHKIIGNKIYSSGRNLTPLKTYKESLDRQQRKLNEAEAIGHIGQWHWKVGGERIEFSDQLYQIFGVKKEEFEATLDSVNKMIDRRDADRMTQVFQRAIIEQNDYDIDFRITRPDGETRYIRCEGRCETDMEDDVIALYGIMQDVTETMQREIDLRQAKDSVERAYSAKSQFLANMSHELRTPLNAVIGFSEMMERQLLGPIGNEKYLEYIKGIRESGEHLLDLISDILDMSKIEAGKYELHLEEFNISKVIRLAAHMMEGRALDANIKIEIHCDQEEIKIVADRRAVMQMTLNLLSNAVKFSKQNGFVNLSLKESDNFITVIVEDQGIGIPANKLANITMPFEQAETDYTREYEGSGLGLSITKELAELHGGQLDIKSTWNVGTKVTIKLPKTQK